METITLKPDHADQHTFIAEHAVAERTSGITALDPLGFSLLQQAIAVTRQSTHNEVEALLRTLTQQAMQGTISWNRNFTITITRAIAQLDAIISDQLARVMHDEKFQRLEGS